MGFRDDARDRLTAAASSYSTADQRRAALSAGKNFLLRTPSGKLQNAGTYAGLLVAFLLGAFLGGFILKTVFVLVVIAVIVASVVAVAAVASRRYRR